jgi:arginyl-tRNA synthetase
MLKEKVQAELEKAIASMVAAGTLPEAAASAKVQVSRPGKGQAGDYSSPVAMQLAKLCPGNPPAVVYAMFSDEFDRSETAWSVFEGVDYAAPGFMNFKLRADYVAEAMADAMRDIDSLHVASGGGEHYLVEFVSVNPNGPVTVGSGRGAALGDAVSRVLHAAGHHVAREYYVNDGVNSEQMKVFGKSVKHHVVRKLGGDYPMPENGYKGDYVEAIADDIIAGFEPEFLLAQHGGWYREHAQKKMLAKQKEDLAAFRVTFDLWVHEQTLFKAGLVDEVLKQLEDSGVAERRDGALWLKSTQFGDDQDRVLVREDGRPTYISGDIAYHEYKYGRGHTRLVDVLGADHHGYVGRLKASAQALGHDPNTLEVLIFQTVRFVQDGKPQPMRKRDGNVYALIDLVNMLGSTAAPNAGEKEQVRIGADMARFFYLSASHDRHMDFDIDLAASQSSNNPCFYAQYAHARARSVLAKAAEAGFQMTSEPAELALLEQPEERSLLLRCLELPWEVSRSAEDFGVHRLAGYAGEVSRLFHDFYEKHRVVQQDDEPLTRARLALTTLAAEAVKQALGLLGVSAPDSMQRD